MKEGANPGMDGLKKLVAGRLATVAGEPHLDADVLTAFAEHALSDAEREQVLQHLGACKDCRETLHLAAEHSPEAQPVLSFQPKRRPWLMLRWGAVAASVVIVGAAVIARYPAPRAPQQLQKQATASADNYSKVADEKAPEEARELRDKLAPTAPLPAKELPERKHMTAKPQAGIEFDDTDQVHIAGSASAEDAKKSVQSLPMVGRNAISAANPAQAKAAPQPSAEWQVAAKDKRETGGDPASEAQSTRMQALHGSAGILGGTVTDPSGAVVSNARVTVNGPVGSKTAASDAQGNFVFDALTPGSYSVKAEAPGFKLSEVTNVAVLENKPAAVGVRLEVGSASEAVEVSGAAIALRDEARADAAPAPAVRGSIGGPLTGLQKARTSDTTAPVSEAQWRLSPQGIVQKSLDFGHTWQKVVISGNAAFRSLCFLKQQVWVGGSAGTLFHSVDSGQNWQQVQPSSEDQKLNSDITHIEFSDPANGSVSASNGEVWSTSDGGRTWRRQ